MDGALGEAAHPQQSFFQFVQIFFEMAFHENFPSVVYNPGRKKADSLRQGRLGRKDNRPRRHLPRDQPKRPVMYASVRGSLGVVKRCGVGLNSTSWPVRRKAVKSLMRA